MPALQLQLLADARHQCQRRTVVKPAQVMRQHPGQQTEAVLTGVLLEIGMKTAHYRDPQAPCRAQGRQAQRAFGGDVQHVRALAFPAPEQFVHRRLTPLQPRIPRQRPAPAEQQGVVAGQGLIAILARAHQLDLMPTGAQAITQAAQGIGHAVDFRREGFGDQGDVQSCRHDPSVSGGHVVIVSG